MEVGEVSKLNYLEPQISPDRILICLQSGHCRTKLAVTTAKRIEVIRIP
jgi:hypothetical protein